MAWDEQLQTSLEGRASITKKQLFALARSTANRVGDQTDDVSVLTEADDQLVFEIRRRSKPLKTFVVLLRETNGADPLTFTVMWTLETVENVADPWVGFFLMEFIGVLVLKVFGLSGFPTYRRFLDDLADAIRHLDPEASVSIGVE